MFGGLYPAGLRELQRAETAGYTWARCELRPGLIIS